MDLVSLQALSRRAIFEWDDAALEGAVRRNLEGGAPAALAAEVASIWLELMRGRALFVEARLPELFARVSASRDPSRVIEVTVLRALLALSAGQLGEALAFARRASLMARTEALPDAELLANLVLARLRRHCGKPYLAVRILEALARTAAVPAPGWLDWERFLAGGVALGALSPAPLTRASRAVAAGQALLLAARAGARQTFEQSASELTHAARGFADQQREALALISLLDPEREADAELLRFRCGDDNALGQGLMGTRVLVGNEEPDIGIVVVARPGERGRRISRDGLGLFGPCKLLSDAGRRRTHGRCDTGLAVLALAGVEPLAEQDFFLRVYGFAYSAGVHRGVLDVLVHRIRQRAGASATLQRANGALLLELHEAIAVADPRCTPPAAARILSALSRRPLATADMIAERLGITERAAQMALQQLVTEGVCGTRRVGRQIQYRLQDSTFSEPTGTDALGASGSARSSAKQA